MYRREHSALLHLCHYVFPHVKPPWQPPNHFHLLLRVSGMHCRIICRPSQLFRLLEELSNIIYSCLLTLTVVQNLVWSNQLNVSHFVIQCQLLPSHSPEIPCRPSKGVPSDRLRLVKRFISHRLHTGAWVNLVLLTYLLMIVSYRFSQFFIIYVFEVKKSISDIPTEQPCLSGLENPGQSPVQEVLMILSYKFLKFLHSLCFRGQGIHCFADIPTELPCLGDLENLGQLPVQQVLGGTGDCVLRIFTVSSLFMFSRVRNPLLAFLLSYHVWVTENPGQLPVWEVLIIMSYKFVKFLQYLCFRGQGIHYWHSYWATLFGWPRKSGSTSGSRATQRFWWLCLMDFHNIFTIHVFKVRESFADISTELSCLGDLENPEQLSVPEVLEVTHTR